MISIPHFGNRKIRNAEVYAKALWYGIPIERKTKLISSDANLLNIFAGSYYYYLLNRSNVKYKITKFHISLLAKVCSVSSALNTKKSTVTIPKGIKNINIAIIKKFIAKYLSHQKQLTITKHILPLLEKGFIRKGSRVRQFNFASRLLFFLIPNLHTYNLNLDVARKYKLASPTTPRLHYEEYLKLFENGFIKNYNQLKKIQFPLNELKEIDDWLYTIICDTDWFKRRVLDIAVIVDIDPYRYEALSVLQRKINNTINKAKRKRKV